jgi:hypothetical protein
VVWGLTARPPVSPAGFPPAIPFARRVLPLRLPSSGFPSSGGLRFVSLGRRPVPDPLRFPFRFPFPRAVFTLALPRDGSAGVGPGRQGPRSPVPPRSPRLDRAIGPHSRWAAAGHDRTSPQNRPLRAGASAGHRRPRTAHMRRLHARAGRTNPLRGQRALEERGSRIGTAASRDAVIGLEQRRISRSWQPDATTSHWRPWPNPWFRMFRVVQHEWEEAGVHLRYVWARHPAIAGGGVRHVQAVSSRAASSPPSRWGAARRAVAATRFTTVPEMQKALSLPGKGLDLRKLVAGAGFEPATSGL